MPLNSIINVSITNTSVQVSQEGFGIPMIMGYHTRFPERIRFYTGTAGMTTDGFAATDPEYVAASKLFSQNPSLTQIAVGRRATSTVWEVELVPTNTDEDTVYTVVVGSESFEYVVLAAATPTVIAAGLATAMAAPTGAWTASAATGTLTLLADATGTLFDTDYDHTLLDGTDVSAATATTGVNDDLDAIQTASDDWYGLVFTQHNEVDVAKVAIWAAAAKKFFISSSMDADILTSATDDVASEMQDLSYTHTGIMFHPRVQQFPEAAWMGRLFPLDPGSATYIDKTLVGIPSTKLSTTQIANLVAKNCSYYLPITGSSYTQGGKAAGGEWLDVVTGLDWLESRIRTDVFAAKAAVDKIPYTDPGVGILTGVIGVRLVDGVTKGVLVPLDNQLSPPEGVFAPRVADVSVANRTARSFPDITFRARLQGAIHSATIVGTVSV